MIKILGKVPSNIGVAVSGGIDSMAMLDFLRRGNHKITALHYNHGTGQYADDAEKLVNDYCTKNNISLIIGRNEEEPPAGVSRENWWRGKRYEFFEESYKGQIAMAHHLDDCVEGWIFSSLNGKGRLIPHMRDQFIRPFLTTEKNEFTLWCVRKGVPTIDDPSNSDTRYRRNYIRHVLMPHAIEVNPGIKKTVRKLLLKAIEKID